MTRNRNGALILCAVVLAGCTPPPPAAIERPASTVLVKGPYPGVIKKRTSYATLRLFIEHQPIPGLAPAGVVGKEAVYASGDNPVTMPFWARSMLKGFHENDHVQFCLKVNWDDDRPVVVTALEHLEPGSQPSLTCR